MIRFLHTSDWQLGMTRRFLAGEAQGRFTQARIDAIRAIARLVRDEHASFVVVAGDVFEDNAVARQTVQRACEALGEIPAPVFLLPGNHDPLDAASVFTSRAFTEARPPNVIVLDDETPRPVPGVDGVDVLGAPWRGKSPAEDLVARALRDAPPPPASVRRVVVGHGALDSLQPDRERVDTIALAGLEAAFRDGRAHYVALGDRHSATAAGATGAVRYSGAPEPTDFREVAAGHVLLVDLGDTAPAVREIAVGTWRFVEVAAELDDDASLDAFEAELRAIPDKERTIVRLRITGSLDVAQNARLEDLVERLGETFAALGVWERHDTLVVRTGDSDPTRLGLSGYARAAWEQLAADAAAGDADAKGALLLLHRLATEVAR